MNNFDLIIPYVKPLKPLLDDEEVSEIMVNATGQVFAERNGRLYLVEGVHIPEAKLQAAVRNIARLLGDDIDESKPLLDARLPDGSRVAAVMPPASVGGTIINIRKFRSKLFTGDELVRRGMLPLELLYQLQTLIEARQTILISGGTGSGKSSLLNALAAYLPQDERIVVIEDTAELSIQSPNLIRLEARRQQDDTPAVSIQDLVRQSLRLRPDRIILGECRGAEAFDLLTAMNTGHQGTLSTIHANTARMAIERFRTCIAMAGSTLPDQAIARNIAEVVQVVIHIARVAGHRHITEVMQLGPYDAQADRYSCTDRYVYEREVIDAVRV